MGCPCLFLLLLVLIVVDDDDDGGGVLFSSPPSSLFFGQATSSLFPADGFLASCTPTACRLPRRLLNLCRATFLWWTTSIPSMWTCSSPLLRRETILSSRSWGRDTRHGKLRERERERQKVEGMGVINDIYSFFPLLPPPLPCQGCTRCRRLSQAPPSGRLYDDRRGADVDQAGRAARSSQQYPSGEDDAAANVHQDA